MSRRKEIALVTAGILAGLAAGGPAAQAAASLMANPSSQQFYLDGQQIALTAYEIGGSNYVKLRDIGKAVDFGIAYDAAANAVIANPASLHKLQAEDGDDLYFLESTGEFVVVSPAGHIRTYCLTDRDYFDRQ